MRSLSLTLSRPILIPLALAFARPFRTRSAIRSRSSWALCGELHKAHYAKSGVMWSESIKLVIFKLLTEISLHITTASSGRELYQFAVMIPNDGPI
jgi:hypothetical protein